MPIDKTLYQQMVESIYSQPRPAYDQSFYSQYNYARKGLDFLADQNDSPEKAELTSLLKSQQGQAVAGGIAAGLNGLTSIVGNTSNLAQTADTYSQEADIQQIGNIGTQNYGNYNQLIQGYNSLNYLNPDLSFDAIRGGSTGERIGNVASSTLSGASTGLTIGGPWGALVGGVVGLGAGIGGWLFGNAEARDKQQSLRRNAALAQKDANVNLGAQSDKISELNYRSGIESRSAAYGGKIRRQENIMDFARRVLNQRSYSSQSAPNKIIRQHCNGGTMIRLKVK